MKNKEKFEKELVEIACSGKFVAVNKETGVPAKCGIMSCRDCLFCIDDTCENESRTRDWAEAEYTDIVDFVEKVLGINSIESNKDIVKAIYDSYKNHTHCVFTKPRGTSKLFVNVLEAIVAIRVAEENGIIAKGVFRNE